MRHDWLPAKNLGLECRRCGLVASFMAWIWEPVSRLLVQPGDLFHPDSGTCTRS